MSKLTILLVSALLFVGGCGSAAPVPHESSWELEVTHSYEFLFEQAQLALQKQYDIASAEESTGVITTAWRTTLATHATFGYRKRLTVTVDGKLADGYSISVKEDQEQNNEQVNPLVEEEAKWEPVPTDGTSAALFRMALHRRLNPSQQWRDNVDR